MGSGLNHHQGWIILGMFVPFLVLSSSFMESVGLYALCKLHMEEAKYNLKQKVHVRRKGEQKLAWGIRMRLSVLHQPLRLPHSESDLVGAERDHLLYSTAYGYQISSVMAYLQITSLLVHLMAGQPPPPQNTHTLPLTWLFKGFKSTLWEKVYLFNEGADGRGE